jgi:hypothetical protein
MGGDLETESNKVTLYSFGVISISLCHVLNSVCELTVFVTDHFDVIDWS